VFSSDETVLTGLFVVVLVARANQNACCLTEAEPGEIKKRVLHGVIAP
jgi:hypothetical protein